MATRPSCNFTDDSRRFALTGGCVVPGDHLQQLIRDVRGGCQQSAQELCDRLGPEILQEIRRRITPAVRRHRESRDFTQDVWAAFFSELPDATKFENIEQVRAFLLTVAKNKMIDALRRTQTKKWAAPESLDDGQHDDAVAGGAATPSQLLIAGERWDDLVRRTPEHLRPILSLLRDGLSRVEIASRLNISEKTVQRAVRQLQRGTTT